MTAEPSEREAPDVRKAKAEFHRHGGNLRMADALRAGVHRRTLYAMRDTGQIEALARGLYRLADAPALGNPDLVTVVAKVPHGVVYLVSALAYHEMTTQIPHEVWIAVPRNSEPPRLDYPPMRAVRLSQAPYAAGIETHQLDGVAVKVYSREKTIADCFKRRNQVGLDTVLEAVRMYKAQGRVQCRCDPMLRRRLPRCPRRAAILGGAAVNKNLHDRTDIGVWKRRIETSPVAGILAEDEARRRAGTSGRDRRSRAVPGPGRGGGRGGILLRSTLACVRPMATPPLIK